MKLFLCGGGSEDQAYEAYEKFNAIINHTKPILYIPLAMMKERYDGCYSWIKNELRNVQVPHIDMVRSAEEIVTKDLSEYGAIFIGGGNTYKLLAELKNSGAFAKIKQYLESDGIVFGGSAGAIIFGQYIDTCKYADKNDVGLRDQAGFDAINNFSLLCHFTNKDQETTDLNRNYLLELSKEEKIIALPEEDTIYVEDGKYEVIGTRPYYVFEYGNMITFNSGIDNKKEFLQINSDSQLMDFMNTHIIYGWLDANKGKHLNNLKNFRENYRISSIEEMLESGLGTCIEQAKMIKYTLDRLGLETKLFCHRSYENADNFDREVRMHCFVLFKYNDSWYHFEHSNILKKGIHKFASVADAVNDITSGFNENDIRELTEIPDIPEKLSYKEFNEYVNQFDKKSLTK